MEDFASVKATFFCRGRVSTLRGVSTLREISLTAVSDLLLSRNKSGKVPQQTRHFVGFRYADKMTKCQSGLPTDTSRGGSFFTQQRGRGNLFVVFTNFCTLPRMARLWRQSHNVLRYFRAKTNQKAWGMCYKALNV